MNELIAKILAEGTKEVIITEPVLAGLTRPLSIRYSSEDGVVVENITYPENTAMERHWGAIENISYVLQTATDVEKASLFSQREYGKDIISDLLVQLKNANLTTAEKGTLLNTIHLVVTMILTGELRVAKVVAESTPTTALYTNARRTWLTGRIQTEIDKL